jgi:hypothetical protein
MYANIQLPSNLTLDPFLAVLVNKLALDMPSFTFNTKGMTKQDLNYATSPSALQDRGVKPPEGTEFLKEVRVYAGAESLGSLAIDRRYKSRGGGDDVYCIKSWRIDNQRGNANTSSTSKLGGAVRIVKKTFIPMNVAEIVGKATSDMHHAYVGSLRDLSRPIDHGNMVPNTTVIQRYLYLLLRNEEIPEALDKKIRNDMLSDKYEAAMLEYMLASKMRDMQMAIVVQHNNLFLYRRPSIDAIEQRTFDELPLAVQNAVAVLQLMEDSELVDDVGYRYNDRNFLIVNTLFDTQE